MIEKYNDIYVYYDPNLANKENRVLAYPIGHGLKIWCNQEVLDEIENHKEIIKQYRLNIKEDCNVYSVYFEDKNLVTQ